MPTASAILRAEAHMADDKKQKCFVIMPFTVREEDLARYHKDSRHWDEVYQGLIMPAVEKAGLICERDDEDSGSRLITENICRKLEEADVILCDLSASNPNVYLELGWALRADKKYVLIKDDVTEFNFDLNQCSTCIYSHMLQPTELKVMIGTLEAALKSTVKDDKKRYSLVRKLQLELGAIEAIRGGDMEAGILGRVLEELRDLRGTVISKQKILPPRLGLEPESVQPMELAVWLPGTYWTNRQTGESVAFEDAQRVILFSADGKDTVGTWAQGGFADGIFIRIDLLDRRSIWRLRFNKDCSSLSSPDSEDVWERQSRP